MMRFDERGKYRSAQSQCPSLGYSSGGESAASIMDQRRVQMDANGREASMGVHATLSLDQHGLVPTPNQCVIEV